VALLGLAPSAGAVVGDDHLEHRGQGGRVDGASPRQKEIIRAGLVLVAGSDDAFQIRDDPPVVSEQVDVVLGGERRAYVVIKHKVGLHAPLDGLDHPRVGGVNQIAKLATERDAVELQRVPELGARAPPVRWQRRRRRLLLVELPGG
jgi:hypothetical protein